MAMAQYDPILNSYKTVTSPSKEIHVAEPTRNGSLSLAANPAHANTTNSILTTPGTEDMEEAPRKDTKELSSSTLADQPPTVTTNSLAPTTEMIVEGARKIAKLTGGNGMTYATRIYGPENSDFSRPPPPARVVPDPLIDPHDVKKRKKPVQIATSKTARHLKKADGEPFWRKDIQYDFLQAVFDDPTKAFTNTFPHCEILASCNEPKLTFCDLYLRSIVESERCSKILRERLLRNREMGKSVAKVCLMVNAGRLNTTINFVPDMRSLMRTYHSIPSLQADPQNGGSKPLQDTPRIKSILKAVPDVQPQKRTLEQVLESPPEKKPNLTPTQLVFFLGNSFKPIPYQYDYSDPAMKDPDVAAYANEGNRFMEFFMNTKIHPANRAKRFLWLMYTYLETSFTPAELMANPFHPRIINPIELLTESQVDDFDQDTDYEIDYSKKMYATRLQCLADEEHNTQPKRGNKAKRSLEDIDDLINSQADEARGEETLPAKKSKKDPELTFTEGNSFEEDADTLHYNLGDELVVAYEAPIPEKFPQIPIANICNISLENFDQYPRVPRCSTCRASQENILVKSGPYIRQARLEYENSGDAFETRKSRLKEWMRRDFETRKNSGNLFVGLEWERIRYDLMNGTESTMNRQIAQLLDASSEDNSNGNSATPVKMECVPIYEDEHSGQLSAYLKDSLAYHHKLFTTVVPSFTPRVNITFDLDKETMQFD